VLLLGSGQYAPLFAEMAAIDLDKYDEMDCTILGLNLLLTTLPDEVYTFEVTPLFVPAVRFDPLTLSPRIGFL
jgi:pantothenate kinase